MPTPTKSLDELKRTGTYKKHSGRYHARVAAVEGFTPLGDPPAHLNKREAAAWNEIRLKAVSGSLAEGDFMLVELAARLPVKSRYNWASFSASESRILQSIANDLGMSPIKRGRISPAKKEESGGKFASILATLKEASKPN